MAAFERLSEHLYRYEDTCAVYVVINPDAPDHATLVDFGAGSILAHLGEIGVRQVDWILHTHHHRDQCQGDWRAAERGLPIAVPSHERHLFDDVENFWQNRRIFHLYYVRNTYFTLTESVPVAAELTDYERFSASGYEFFVLPTPGHTLGSVTLLAEIDGRKVAFSGDLIHSPGKVVTFHDLQYQYGATDGVDFALVSLHHLRNQGPQLLCPSHGEVMADPEAGLAALQAKLRGWLDFYNFGQAGSTLDEQFLEVTPHVVECTSSTSQFYAIIADSGQALFVDYGSASGNYFGQLNAGYGSGDRLRFVEHGLDTLRARWGMQRIAVAMPSHMHDDHLNGFPYLQRHHGTQVWAYENMKDILEHPQGHLLGCTNAEPIRVDRTVGDWEEMRWEDFCLTAIHSPGHTEYQMALLAEIDGKRVAFTGDNYFKDQLPDGAVRIRHNVIYRNHVEKDSHLRAVEKLLRFEPEVIAPGHGPAFDVTRADLEHYAQRMRTQQEHWEDLIAGETNYGLDPAWSAIYPYQSRVAPGSAFTVEVRLRNYGAAPTSAIVALRLPRPWEPDADSRQLDVAASGSGVARFTIHVPADFTWPYPRLAIAADVTVDGQQLGQITEAVVDVTPQDGPAGYGTGMHGANS